MNARNIKITVLSFIGFIILVSFQNCTGPDMKFMSKAAAVDGSSSDKNGASSVEVSDGTGGTVILNDDPSQYPPEDDYIPSDDSQASNPTGGELEETGSDDEDGGVELGDDPGGKLGYCYVVREGNKGKCNRLGSVHDSESFEELEIVHSMKRTKCMTQFACETAINFYLNQTGGVIGGTVDPKVVSADHGYTKWRLHGPCNHKPHKAHVSSNK